MTIYMLDTDTVSFALRGNAEVVAAITQRRPSELRVSAITIAELRYGAERRGSAKIHKAIDAFTAGVHVVPFDDVAAARFGMVAAHLSDAGMAIGQMDTLIAAHALSIGATLVTHNARHFSRVSTLRTIDWVRENIPTTRTRR